MEKEEPKAGQIASIDQEKLRPEERRQALRNVIGLSLVATAGLSVIALRQLGVVKKLPELPISIFNSERVVMSPDARKLLGIPDGILGSASYALTLALAWRDHNRSSGSRSLALCLKIGLDLCVAGFQSARQWPKFGCLCSWCMLPVVSSVSMAVLMVPHGPQKLGNSC